MMEMGQLVSSEVLPKVAAELKKAALEGGAFALALKNLRVTEGQLMTQAQRSGDNIFKSGFSEGLSQFYKTLSEELQSTGKAQEDIGNIYKNFFKALSKGVKVLTPLLEAVIQVVSKMTDAVALSYKGWKLLYTDVFQKAPDAVQSMTLIAGAIGLVGLALKSTFGKGLLLLGVFQEIASLFDDKLVGALEAQIGTQFNIKDMTQTGLRKDDKGNFYSKGKSQGLFDTGTGMAVGVGGSVATFLATVATLNLAFGGLAKSAKLVGGAFGILAGKSAANSVASPARPTKFNRMMVTAGSVSLAFGVGTAIGDFINDNWLSDEYKTDLGRSVAKSLAFLGSDSAQQALDAEAAAGGFTPTFQKQVDAGYFGDRYANTQQLAARSQNTTVNISGIEVPITIANPSDLDQAREAGRAASEGFYSSLEDRLGTLIKGGR